MVEIRVEVCMISARGLSRSPTLWKHHWYAVGWINSKDKYRTAIDTSGNRNPDWKTKFTSVVDDEHDVATLCVEVYSRDPIFLREKLQGSTSISLKEFLDKHKMGKTDGSEQGGQDVGSFQLRKKNSSKPNGFVDISIRTLEGKDGAGFYTGHENGFQLSDSSGSGIMLNTGSGSVQTNQPQQGLTQLLFSHHPGNVHQPQQSNYPYTLPVPYPSNYMSPSSMVGPSYQQTVGQGPSFLPTIYPAPPSNVGSAPVNGTSMYVNMPQTQAGRAGGAPGGGRGGGFAAGVGAGALAAGAVIMGDDLMSGFDFSSSGFQNPTFGLAINPPF